MSLHYINNKLPIVSHRDIQIVCGNKDVFLSRSLSDYLKKTKEEIDKHQTEWDHVKKYINPYEFIHTKVPGYRQSVCKYQPISRSFFKLYEIMDIFSFQEFLKKTNVTSLHLAEAPGGFVESLQVFANSNKCKIKKSVGLSLIRTNDTDVPLWNRNYINSFPNVFIDSGIDNCDLTSPENYKHLYAKYSHGFDIITADGGFDFSSNFNDQEILSQPLIMSEILYAITMQNTGGCFVLKIFDCFTKLTAELIYILCSMYEKVYIYKPNTSRLANSEKYIVCKNYINTRENRAAFSNIVPDLLRSLNKISSLLNFELPLVFLNKMEEINAILGQQQLEAISNTITLINNSAKKDKLVNLKENNIQKCITWCKKHDFGYTNLSSH
tara:strand:+ start:1014 stop:2159 length:1146 start_codon:yes stop_codon:yes gene_type:complete